MDQILTTIRSFDGVVELAPAEGSEFPEIAWGDHFFYYSPDGQVPGGQPYATIVTKDYPDDTTSQLDPPRRYRVNIQVSRDRFAEVVVAADPAEADVVQVHPVYGAQSWVSVINPGPRTLAVVSALLEEAHRAARLRAERRGRPGSDSV